MPRLSVAAVAVLFLTAAFPTAVCAQEAAPAPSVTATATPTPENLALAERLVTVAQGDNLDKQMNEMLRTAFDDEGLSDEHQAWLNAQARPMVLSMVRNILRDMTPVYAEVFTAEELTAQIEFYETPIGRAIVDKSLTLVLREEAILAQHQHAFLTELMTKFCAQFDCDGGAPGGAKTRR